MSDLLELAERCEKAEGPDRELDCDIALAVGWDIKHPLAPLPELITTLGIEWLRLAATEYQSTYKELPAYTASIDAALTLVPDGRILRQYMVSRHVPHTCEVAVDYAHGGWVGHSDHSFALALCAAALRARAA